MNNSPQSLARCLVHFDLSSSAAVENGLPRASDVCTCSAACARKCSTRSGAGRGRAHTNTRRAEWSTKCCTCAASGRVTSTMETAAAAAADPRADAEAPCTGGWAVPLEEEGCCWDDSRRCMISRVCSERTARTSNDASSACNCAAPGESDNRGRLSKNIFYVVREGETVTVFDSKL